MTAMLASVVSTEEARIVLECGTDIIDLKDPSRGALGALDPSIIRKTVRMVAGRASVSATVGDIPCMTPGRFIEAVDRTAETGVDIIKAGFFPGASAPACALALEPATARGLRLVGVLFADLDPDFTLLSRFAASGFYGVMLDTALKNGTSLTSCFPPARLADFLMEARRLGLMTGLAGSLRHSDIAPLLPIGPDYLGFRGALCTGSNRNARLDKDACVAIRQAIPHPRRNIEPAGHLPPTAVRTGTD